MYRIILQKMFLLCIAFSACTVGEVLEEKATVGQIISIPCGVKVKGTLERLVWKVGDVNKDEDLAIIYEGVRQCNEAVKENCVQRPDGSLELHNVQESDSGDYFCVVDLLQKYYSQHTLVVLPEVIFEGCPNSDDVFVSQVGPNTKVIAYTSPVCMNADVVGIVSCDPPSGVKVGMNVTEINCTCTHPAGRVTDICMIPLPEASPCFVDDSEPTLEPGPRAVGSRVTLLGVVVGIITGIFLSVLPMCFYKRYKRHSFRMILQSPDTDLNPVPTRPEFTGLPRPFTVDNTLTISNIEESDEGMFSCVDVFSAGDAITSCNVVFKEPTLCVQPSDKVTSIWVDRDSHASECDLLVTDCGNLVGYPIESDSTVVDVSDANTKTTPPLPTCNEIRGFVVEDISARVRILPSRTNYTEGITIFCKQNENLTVGFIQRDSSTLPKLIADPNIGEMTISVADETVIPLSIQCLKCGTMCCILEVCGGEWSDK